VPNRRIRYPITKPPPGLALTDGFTPWRRAHPRLAHSAGGRLLRRYAPFVLNAVGGVTGWRCFASIT